MHLSEILKAELKAFTERTGNKKLRILETGTIRGATPNYEENDGWSTVTFAEHVKANGGLFTSIDLDISTATTVLKSKKLYTHVQQIQGYSVDVLAGLATSMYTDPNATEGSYDIAFLDSDNNGSLIFHEYMVVKHMMRSPGLIIVDDVNMNSQEVLKGHEILPWLIANEIPHRLLERTGDGYRTGVLVFEV